MAGGIRAIMVCRLRLLAPIGHRWMSTGKPSWALVINAGSSSLKYALYSVERLGVTHVTNNNDHGHVSSCDSVGSISRAVQLASGLISEIGGQSVVTHKSPGKENSTLSSVAHMPNHTAALSEMIRHLTDPAGGLVQNPEDIAVVGHRVVHGADSFNKAVVVDETVEKAIEEAARLAPLHNPANLIGIREAKQLFSCPHVAVFDTAFHATIPKEAYTYAIPLDLAAKHKIRKYGFHGTSHCFVLKQCADRLGKRSKDLNAIILHLGNGASMACIDKGVCVDTTMGLTPLEGLVMGTRSGDLDCGVYTHLTREQGLSPSEVDALLNKKSGLMGLCGLSDMRQIIEAADAGEKNAQLALSIFVERIRKYLGSYIVKLNGNVDALVFTAGIGENSDRVRAMVCRGLHPLGISIDDNKNTHVPKSGGVISTVHSHTKVLVIPTDEELAIALQSIDAANVLRPLPSPTRVETQTLASPLQARAEVASQGTSDVFHPMDDAPGVYIAASNRSPMSDSSVPEVGLMYALEPQVSSLGYFRPIAYHEQDRRIDLVKQVFAVEDEVSDMYGVTLRKAVQMMAHENEDGLIQLIMEKFSAYKKRHDFIIVSGLNQAEMPAGAQFLNTKLADALNLPMVWSTDAASFPRPGTSRVLTVLEEIEMVKPKDSFKHVPLAGVIATEVPRERISSMRTKIEQGLAKEQIKTLAVMPVDMRIRMRTLREVSNVLGAQVICGSEMLDHNHVGKMIVGTLQVADLIDLIATRADVQAAQPSSIESLSQHEVEELREAFKKFDKFNTGQVATSEIVSVMRSLGWDASQAEVDMILSESEELEGISSVTFMQFIDIMSHKPYGADSMPGGSVLVVTHIGRVDVLLSLVMASKSKKFPKIGGILLTDGSKKSLPKEILNILTSGDVKLPVMTIPLDTFEATQRIHGLHGLAPRLLPNSTLKLRAAQEIFALNACQDFLNAIVRGKDIRHEMTSRHFQYFISNAARQSQQHIVLPEGEDWRVVVAAAELIDRGLCKVTILGRKADVLAIAEQHHVDLSSANIINPTEAPDFEDFANELVKLRSKKGMTINKARQLLQDDFTWYGTLMMHTGKCDGMVSGACHTTADTMRPALQIIKTSPGTSLVSSVFFMLLPDRVYLFGDCAINVDPTAEELSQIALSCAETATAFGIEPRVAMLSYATGQSNSGPIVDKVRQATEKAKAEQPNLLIEGPTQFDAAVDMEVAAVKNKGKQSSVLGRATVCVFPDLNSGNNTYKAVQQAARCIAVGPIMQGLRLPVNDLSRGCTVNDVVNTVIITCNQAVSAKRALEKTKQGAL